MSILSLLYWIILVISAIFTLYPAFSYPSLVALALFVIIGLKTFPLPIS